MLIVKCDVDGCDESCVGELSDGWKEVVCFEDGIPEADGIIAASAAKLIFEKTGIIDGARSGDPISVGTLIGTEAGLEDALKKTLQVIRHVGQSHKIPWRK